MTTTTQEAIDEAKKYASRSEFFRGSQWAYERLRRNRLLDDACAHMHVSPKYSYTRWTHRSALDEAAKYRNRSEFKRGNAGAYEYALSNRILDQACAHMRDGQCFWHVFELMAVAVKYDNWSEFIKAEPQAYNWANKNKLIDIASAHMTKRREWDKESVLSEAAKHQSRGMFIAMASGAYKHALVNGYVDEVFAHLENKRGVTWSKSMVLAEAAKYGSRTEFQVKEAGAYYHAMRNGYIDEACSHMEVKKRTLDREFVLAEAKKYKSRSHFKLMEPSCYLHAKRNGFLEDACAHMKLLPSGFKDAGPATLYHLRVSGPGGIVLYKIGITNRTPKDRIQSLYLSEGFSAEVLEAIQFDSGRDARIAEKRLHRKLAPHRYKGPPVMNNGNTEVFTVPVFEA